MDSEFHFKVKAKLVYVKDFHVAVVLVITGYIICKCICVPQVYKPSVTSMFSYYHSYSKCRYEDAGLGERFTKRCPPRKLFVTTVFYRFSVRDVRVLLIDN